MTTLSPPTRAVLPIRALAYDGDDAFVVERASDPPTSAAHHFRVAAAPIAARAAEQIRMARDLMAGATLDAAARAAVGQGLQRVVTELRQLAESYDITPVIDVCRAREAGAATLDPRAVAGVEHVAHALLGAAAEHDAKPTATVQLPTDAPADAPADAMTNATGAVEDAAPPAPFRPATGPALVELLEHGITGIQRFRGTPLDMPAVPAPAPPPAIDGVVAIDQLCYRGRAALDRARAVRDELRDADGPPDPALLDELYDLLDLATLD